MSITDLADACQVGDTSVYRFCRTMNLQGYQEFKTKLSLNQGAVSDKEKDSNVSQNMAETVMNVNISAIKETFTLLNMEEIEKVLKMFEGAKRVYFFGIGDSLLTAQRACKSNALARSKCALRRNCRSFGRDKEGRENSLCRTE